MSTSMRELLRKDEGLSVAELLVVLVLMSLVISLAYLILNAAGNLADRSIARAAASDQSQAFVDRAGRELREAQEAVEDAGAFKEIGARRVVFYSDASGNSVPERITYYISDGAVYRTVATCSDTVIPFEHFGSDSAPQKLVDEVDPAWSGAIFTYYDEDNNITTNPAAVARVDVEIRSRAESGQREWVSTAAAIARIRSVHNSLGGT